MIIKGIEFDFYCAKCKGLVKDVGSNKSLNVRQCNCHDSSSEKGFNGIRLNKE
jgi:hypothetical protein